MQILSKQIGRLPFALASILLYVSVPLYYAAWEYETVEPYLSEPTGLVMGLFSILGSGIPFCFAHQVGGLASLEFTAPLRSSYCSSRSGAAMTAARAGSCSSASACRSSTC